MLGREASRDLAPLAAGADRAGGSTRLLAVEANRTGKGLTGMAAHSRTLGQQLGQVAQQGTVTGNYLGALAVQVPDIALGFGSVAIAAFIVGTVALPLLIGAMGGGKSAAEQMAEATDGLSESIGSLKDISAELSNLDTLAEKYGEVDAALLTLIGHQLDQQIAAAQTAALDAI